MASGDGGNRHRTWNIQHSRRLAQYNARLERILRQAVTRAASSVTRRNATAAADTPFTFKADRVLDSEIDSLMKDLAAEITAVTGGAERTEWYRAQSQAVRYLTDLYDVAEQSKGRQDAFNDTMLTMRSRNLDALDEFQKRKIGGMTLSEKVWDCTADFKGQMECAIDTALLEGKSAASLAQSVQGLLDNPDALFRRVRDAGGTLRLSKAAKAFHPGKGKYRSAHKNAMRLARTEINMAYRASDCNVAQTLDCVVGIRVNLSNNHNCEGVPTGQFTDICDQLAGDYPKDFKFTGWHPQCRCFITYINKTDEEFWRDLENGENNPSVNTVKDVPDAFKQWVSDNSDRLNKAEAKGSVPYFIKDNKQTVERIRTERKEAKPDKPTNEEMSYMQTVSDKPKASSINTEVETQTTNAEAEIIIQDKIKTEEKIKELKNEIHPFNGISIEDNTFETGKMTVLRRSLRDVYKHAIEDENVRQWLQHFDINSLKTIKYRGWAENRPYSIDHPRFDPENPNKLKHTSDTDYFLYYTIEINGLDYWVNVKMHKHYGEVLYTIERNKPDDIIEGHK